MQKAASQESSRYNGKRHRVYSPQWIIEAIDKIGSINAQENKRDENRSKIFVTIARAYIRKNLSKLRAAGYVVPADFEAKKRKVRK